MLMPETEFVPVIGASMKQAAELEPSKVAISVLSGTCIKDQLDAVFQLPDEPEATQVFTVDRRQRHSSNSTARRRNRKPGGILHCAVFVFGSRFADQFRSTGNTIVHSVFSATSTA